MRRTIRQVIGVFIIAICAVSTALAQTSPAAYASPADVVAACRAAHARGDVAMELDCYSPAFQAEMVKMLITMIAATPATQPAGQSLDAERAAFFAKYHLEQRQPRPGESKEDVVNRLAAHLPDQRAFLLDFMTHQQTDKARRRAAASTQPAAREMDKATPPELGDVQIDPSGTSATGKLTKTSADGRGSISVTVKFEKAAGSWCLASMMMF